jgi:hypothetical protein
MVRRFSEWFGRAPNDKEIMGHARQLKILAWRHDDDRLTVEFRIEGSFGKMGSNVTRGSDPDAEMTEAEGMDFARRLLAEFAKGVGPSEGAC